MIDRTTVQKIILGTVQFGLKYGVSNKGGKPSEQEAFAILDEARRLGIERLDTAEGYGDAMAVIGRYHADRPPFKVLGKFGLLNDDKDIIKKAKNALVTLGVKKLEVYSYHSFNDFLKYPDTQKALVELKDQQLIRKIGVSVYTNREFEAAISSPIIEVVQIPFNIFDNHHQRGTLMAKAKKHGKEIHVRSVFLQGLFFLDGADLPAKLKPFAPYLEKIKDFCAKQKISMNELALTYVLQSPNIDGVLIGVDRAEQLTENLSGTRPDKARAINDFVDTLDIKETELLNPVNWKS